ncbi:MAG: hypothetical protein U5K74_04065 [Gemmatimonadaceae bacterium]|nr:hypothetical protein [Gemmatimonadaceae bacterium]
MALPPEMKQPDSFDPRHAWLLALVTCVVGTMLLAYPALSGQFLVNIYSDQYIAGYSFREFGAQVLRATGGFALWNPYLFGGMPYVGAMHGDIFYPTALLRLAMPTDAAMTWGMILHYILGGYATYVFLRALGLKFFGALVGAVAYMLSGWNASYVSPGHDGKIFVGAMLPLAMLCVLRGVRDGRNWAWGGLSLVVGLGMLSPHPQLMQYLLMGTGVFGLYVAFGIDGRPDQRQAVRRLAFALGAVALGFAISAIQYLPVMEYTPFSPRAGGRGYDFATSFSFPPVELINTLIPEFTGILDKYWGPNGIHHHSEYIGAAVWLLAVAAFRTQARTRDVLFWGGVVVLFTLWALGGNTPFYQIIYNLVPGSKFFRAPSTVFFVATFAMAILAGFGAQSLVERAPSRRFLLAGAGTIALLFLLGVTGAMTGIAGAFAAPEVAERVQEQRGSPDVRDDPGHGLRRARPRRVCAARPRGRLGDGRGMGVRRYRHARPGERDAYLLGLHAARQGQLRHRCRDRVHQDGDGHQPGPRHRYADRRQLGAARSRAPLQRPDGARHPSGRGVPWQ